MTRANDEQYELILKSELRPAEMFVPINSFDHFEDVNLERNFLIIKNEINSDEYLIQKNKVLDHIAVRSKELFGTELSDYNRQELSSVYDQEILGSYTSEDLKAKIQSSMVN